MLGACRAAWAEFIHQVIGAAEPASDLVGAPVRALAAALELSFVSQAMTEPAAKAWSAVEDAASAPAAWTVEPLPLAPERCRRRPDFNALVDDLG